MTRHRLLPSVAVALLPVGLLLTGCSFSASAGLTVPASDIADAAAGALEEQVGPRVDLLTISDVEGTKYHVAVQVADTAN
jgi:hypothetical protein